MIVKATLGASAGVVGAASLVLKKPRKAKASKDETVADASEMKLSCVAAALKGLGESNEPMNAQEMITAAVTETVAGRSP